MDDTSKLFCPLLKDICVGKRCAVAVNSSMYRLGMMTRVWACGLISSKENNVQVIYQESLEDS